MRLVYKFLIRILVEKIAGLGLVFIVSVCENLWVADRESAPKCDAVVQDTHTHTVCNIPFHYTTHCIVHRIQMLHSTFIM